VRAARAQGKIGRRGCRYRTHRPPDGRKKARRSPTESLFRAEQDPIFERDRIGDLWAMLLAMHPVAMLTVKSLAASHPAPQSAGIQLWQVIVAFGVILGIIVGLGTFLDWGSKIRNRRVDEEVREMARAKLEAEDIKSKLDGLTQLSDTLQKQIDAVPKQADRLFLERRMESLAASITRDFDEYRDAEIRLQAPDLSPVFDPVIREAIQRAIVPGQRTRERRNVYVLVLLVTLVALNLSPISISSIIYQYFSVLADSAAWTASTIAVSIATSTLIFTIIFMFASELYTPLKEFFDKQRRLIWYIAPLILVGVLVALGFWLRESVLYQECHPYACFSDASPVPNDASAIALNIAPLIAGVWLFAILRIANRARSKKAGG